MLAEAALTATARTDRTRFINHSTLWPNVRARVCNDEDVVTVLRWCGRDDAPADVGRSGHEGGGAAAAALAFSSGGTVGVENHGGDRDGGRGGSGGARGDDDEGDSDDDGVGGWDDVELDGPRVELWTTRAVGAGEELLLNYGPSYVAHMRTERTVVDADGSSGEADVGGAATAGRAEPDDSALANSAAARCPRVGRES